MNDKNEALNLALEALNKLTDVFLDTEGNHGDYEQKAINQGNKAITAIKEALAQPEHEPVAFVKGCNRGQWEIFPAKAHQIFGIEQPLYATPPQHTWIGLTPADFEKLEQNYGHKVANDFILADIICDIEAKLKEKNT